MGLEIILDIFVFAVLIAAEIAGIIWIDAGKDD